jgi:hypothetical protein
MHTKHASSTQVVPARLQFGKSTPSALADVRDFLKHPVGISLARLTGFERRFLFLFCFFFLVSLGTHKEDCCFLQSCELLQGWDFHSSGWQSFHSFVVAFVAVGFIFLVHFIQSLLSFLPSEIQRWGRGKIKITTAFAVYGLV